MMITPQFRSRFAGNTYVEYLLIGFLVLLVSVAGWMSIGKGFKGIASMLKQEFQHHAHAAVLVKANGTGDGSPGVSHSLGSNPSASLGMNCSMVHDKYQCLVQNPPPVTLGGNGDNMQAIIYNWLVAFMKSLGIDVKPDPNALLARLAQQGHQVAFLQEVMEALSSYSADDLSKMKDSTVVIDGKEYTVQQLVDMLNQLTAQVQQQQQAVQDSSLPAETVASTQENSSTIVDNGQQAAQDAQQALNQPDPSTGTTSTTPSDPGTTSTTPSDPGTTPSDPTAAPPSTSAGPPGDGTVPTGDGSSTETDTAANNICANTNDPSQCTTTTPGGTTAW